MGLKNCNLNQEWDVEKKSGNFNQILFRHFFMESKIRFCILLTYFYQIYKKEKYSNSIGL